MSKKPLLLLTMFGALGIASLHAQEIPCGEARVEYEKTPQSLNQHIRIYRRLPSNLIFKQGDREFSAQGTRWLIVKKPDYLKTGPWSTTLYIGARGENRPFLELSFRDHGNTFTASWLNEKLLYISVWWGRIASSELILNIEKRIFIYNETANYGQVTSCKESK